MHREEGDAAAEEVEEVEEVEVVEVAEVAGVDEEIGKRFHRRFL
jgi:hypothetical protein